jgi:hypothetical protein
MGITKNKKRLTKQIIEHLQPGQVVWDTEIQGLGIRKQIRHPTFVLKFVINKRQKYCTIGKYLSPWTIDGARAEARAIVVRSLNGESITNKIRDETMHDLCDRYVREHCPRKKASSAKSDRGIIDNHIRPLLGEKRVVKVTRSDVEQFQTDVCDAKTAPLDARTKQLSQKGGRVVRGGQGVANRSVALLSKMFNLAEDWGLRPQNSNPARRIRKFSEVRRNRFLSTDELKRLGLILKRFENDEPYPVAAIRLLIFTGARSSEILGLGWEHVDLQRKALHLACTRFR